MCVPAHLFRPHYCQACVNKYPGVERSSVPVLHHRGAQSAGCPLLSCSRADRNHDYTVSTVVIHLLPKLRHCTPSYTPPRGHAHIHGSCTWVHIRTGTHTLTNKYLQIFALSFPLFFPSVQPRVCRQHGRCFAICTVGTCLQQRGDGYVAKSFRSVAISYA